VVTSRAVTNVYLDLTEEFNRGRLRAVICSGQAVVLHRLAVASKDGGWILREDEKAVEHVRRRLARHGARYRFGAPLDVRWLSRGWSSHFEFRRSALRVRTDFFTRPPRITPARLRRLWAEQQGRDLPFVGPVDLAEMKKTDREKDYPVIGELARLMDAPGDRLLQSRSARDLADLAAAHPDLARRLAKRRPILRRLSVGREAIEAALDAERRDAMRENERRLERFARAAEKWRHAWPSVEREIAGLDLLPAHEVVVERAIGVLPFRVR
jgi:hypothetical protein